MQVVTSTSSLQGRHVSRIGQQTQQKRAQPPSMPRQLYGQPPLRAGHTLQERQRPHTSPRLGQPPRPSAPKHGGGSLGLRCCQACNTHVPSQPPVWGEIGIRSRLNVCIQCYWAAHVVLQAACGIKARLATTCATAGRHWESRRWSRSGADHQPAQANI